MRTVAQISSQLQMIISRNLLSGSLLEIEIDIERQTDRPAGYVKAHPDHNP